MGQKSLFTGFKLIEQELIRMVFPEWLKSDEKSDTFRTHVLDKHTIVEHFLDLLIVARFFGKVDSKESEVFRSNVLANMNFLRKVKALSGLGLLKKIESEICTINNFRVAQAHIKKNDPLREPSKENWDNFNKCKEKVFHKLLNEIILRDGRFKEKLEKLMKSERQTI